MAIEHGDGTESVSAVGSPSGCSADRLSPAEGTSFVLHYIFGFPFGAVAELGVLVTKLSPAAILRSDSSSRAPWR